MTDIEIARNAELKPIEEIAKKLGIEKEEIEQYGKYKAKFSNSVYEKIKENKKGKLILVTAMSPTPLGEGKTTISIAIADGLSKIGKKSILALREPSLGPVFGIKGGATGGGRVQVAPMEDINLHFTGDIHAITTANNLLSSLIDNHIYFGNELEIEKVTWKRCMDLNDRQLRKIETGLSEEKNIKPREDGFDITVASEIMAILCLAQNKKELKEMLGNIIIGYNKKEEPIYAKQLNGQGAMAVLLKDAIKPNLVQTLEHTPAIIHGGPFANIAHGCNSIIATNLAMHLADYTITEAGFGADLGAEKFLDIKCRKAGIKPNAVVLVTTIKAIKYHGGVPKEEIQKENLQGLEKGIKNVYKHIENLKRFGLDVIVALNKYTQDTKQEIEWLENKLKEKNIMLSLVEGWEKGGEGATDIAQKIVKMVENKKDTNSTENSENTNIAENSENASWTENTKNIKNVEKTKNKEQEIKYTYNLEESIKQKIEKVAKNIYYAEGVEYSKEAEEKISQIEKLGYSKLPICIAKTQYSFSDDAKNLDEDSKYIIHIRDIELKAGAGFIVVLAGKIMTMPGLPKVPAAEKIDIREDEEIVGIF